MIHVGTVRKKKAPLVLKEELIATHNNIQQQFPLGAVEDLDKVANSLLPYIK